MVFLFEYSFLAVATFFITELKMGNHTVWELKQKQSLPLDAKIQMTRLRLKQWHIVERR